MFSTSQEDKILRTSSTKTYLPCLNVTLRRRINVFSGPARMLNVVYVLESVKAKILDGVELDAIVSDYE